MVAKRKCKEWVRYPNPYVNVNVSIDTLKFDANADANVDFDAKCEWTLRHLN